MDIHPPPRFFEFKLAHLITLIMLTGFGVNWWLKHEATASSTDQLQNQVMDQQAARFNTDEARIEKLDTKLTRMENEMYPDIREIKTKMNVMVELLDGGHKYPELHAPK